MGCCSLAEKTVVVAGKRMKVCRNCWRVPHKEPGKLPVPHVRQIVVRIYPVSNGNAENTEYRCNRCGKRKTRNGRPKDLSLYNVESDWLAK